MENFEMEEPKHSLGQAQGREAETDVQGVDDRRDRPRPPPEPWRMCPNRC